MLKSTFIFFFAFLCINAYSQTEPRNAWLRKGYQAGYIITSEGDTLYGYLKDRTPPPFGKRYGNVRVKSYERGITGGYSPYEISQYCIKGDCFKSMWYHEESFFFNVSYYSLEGEGEKIFMKVIVDDYLSLYYKEYIDEDNSYVQYIPFFKREDEYHLQRATQGLLGLKKKQLSLYFKDCPELVSLIQEHKITSPTAVASYYNDCKKNGGSILSDCDTGAK